LQDALKLRVLGSIQAAAAKDEPMTSSDRTPSQDRGTIQAGATGDKTPGFDPAAAPLETDAEAGDAPGAARATPPRGRGAANQASGFTNEASFANAMQPIEGEANLQPRRNWPILVIAAIVIVAAAVFVIAAAMR
jgi:hypothetical protein